ncbi:MAG: tRNA (5-methylaminomethyl-2-thiouridine)(34)-methyltransferase MnmD [Burkholderiaceae bacterium]
MVLDPTAEFEPTADGSTTRFSSRFGEHYHSRFGALTQARTVFLGGTQLDRCAHAHVLEIGFGLGLNFLVTLADVTARKSALDYLAYEFDPQPAAVLAACAQSHPGTNEPLWQALIDAWPRESKSPGCEHQPVELEIGERRLRVIFSDATSALLPTAWADAVYLDGFSRKVNPELWTPAFVCRLARCLRPSGWIATYSAAGEVRRALSAAGLEVERCEGLPGKREWLRAQKT